MIDIFSIPGPVWHNGYNHEGYVASFDCLPRPKSEWKKFDIYVWENHWGQQEVCLRFGEEDSHYYSPGTHWNVIGAAHHIPEYNRAVDILKDSGIRKAEDGIALARVEHGTNVFPDVIIARKSGFADHPFFTASDDESQVVSIPRDDP